MVALLTGCGTLVLREAPASCGFPAGTALSYAGRSTTATLGVQEVVGDPMSHDPADIYITRDAFDQGEHHGRLVCAIFVEAPDFVEVTVHPADDGRIAAPQHVPALPPPDGISRQEALDAALGSVPEADAWEVRAVTAGPVDEVGSMWQFDEELGDLPPDLWVWRVYLVRGDRGVDVAIDFVDGTVYGDVELIVN